MERDSPDLVIRNGRVIDPANDMDEIADVAIKNGKILQVGKDLHFMEEPKEVFDASGCLITPGLIDMHVHVYQYAIPLGVNPDEVCLSRGVTTAVDAGSAGATTFPGLRKYVAEKSKTRVLAFVHIASHGLSSIGHTGFHGKGGELDSLNQVDTDMCVDFVNKNRDMAVGVKIRLTEYLSNSGEHEEESFRRARAASLQAGVPLMVHHLCSNIPTHDILDHSGLSCPGNLQSGDIYTHCFHARVSTIINPDTSLLYPSIHNARKRGVLFDLGHGRQSFSWTVAELCAKQNFWPDTISTDLHIECHKGPAYDLPLTMTKMMHVGMPLYDVIKAVTMTPAAAIGWSDIIGSLSTNRVADVTVLKEDNAEFELEDCQGQRRRIKRRLVPVAVWKDGVQYSITQPASLPGPDVEGLVEGWDALVVKDQKRPFTS